MYKNKLDFILSHFIFFSKKISLNQSDFYNNEIYVHINNTNKKYINMFFNNSYIDLVTYEDKNKNLVHIEKYYLHELNKLVCIVTNRVSVSKTNKNKTWLLRESKEFFLNNHSTKLEDSRNLLLNYGDQNKYLSKSVNVSGNFDLKVKKEKIKKFFKTNVTL